MLKLHVAILKLEVWERKYVRSVHCGINPPLKNTTRTFSPSGILNLQTVQAPFLSDSLLYIGFS